MGGRRNFFPRDELRGFRLILCQGVGIINDYVMRHTPFLPLAVLLASTSLTLIGQTPPAPAAPKNLIGNGGFETGFRRDNLWDGVDATGLLSSERGALPVLTTSGTIAETSMPVSVSLADMNGDGLIDIATTDVLGYFRIYFNSGTKEAPAFTIAELGSLFLSRPSPEVANSPIARRGPRAFLSDMTRSGGKSLIVGNYIGEILLIPNSGSGVKPDFRQPPDLARAVIPTMKDSTAKWGNVFAPATWDWNRDGKDDLLVGEGSYSANSIHLLLNEGSGASPKFSEDSRSVLAYGMGLEQLSPTVADYNGDGNQDLLVTERTGKVAVYLNSGKPWKPGETLPFDSFVPVGGAAAAGGSKDPMEAAKGTNLLSVGGLSTIANADMNGDGLFDLVFGKSNGRVAISLNTGTKTAPKFAAPIELKGEANTPAFSMPSGWDVDFGLERGNFYGFVSIVKAADDPQAQPAEGTACFKAGYVASPNKSMPVPTQFFTGAPTFRAGVAAMFAASNIVLPASMFKMTQAGRGPLKVKTSYVFSMKVKGNRATDAAVNISYVAEKKLSDDKIKDRGDRGAVTVERNVAREEKNEFFTFSVGPQWAEVKKEFTVKLDNKELADLTQVTTWATALMFNLSPGAGTIYIDDMKIIEK